MRFVGLVAALWCLVAPAAWAAPGNPPTSVAPRAVALKRVVFNLKEGEVWGHWGNPIACDAVHYDLRWKAGSDLARTDLVRLSAIFDEEVSAANLKTTQPTNLFDTESAGGGLQVGALVKNVHVRMCGNWNDTLIELAFRISGTMDVEWQVYDPIRREVIGKIETVGKAESRDRTGDALERTIIATFRDNARNLLASPDFQKLISAPSESVAGAASVAPAVVLTVALASGPGVPIAQASGSVVTVLSEDGHGSGFLVTSDGYLITNRHVVGSAKTVRVRWSDGFESLGDVVRSDARRDVALIKSSAHGRQPLTVRQALARPGDTVFAIGTPLDEKLQGTITRGVVSAYRVDDGLNYLQSDVTINPGNSGGPLVDEKGAVVGIAALTLRVGEDAPTGVNFFIPIGDALDFLNLKPAPGPAAASAARPPDNRPANPASSAH